VEQIVLGRRIWSYPGPGIAGPLDYIIGLPLFDPRRTVIAAAAGLSISTDLSAGTTSSVYCPRQGGGLEDQRLFQRGNWPTFSRAISLRPRPSGRRPIRPRGIVHQDEDGSPVVAEGRLGRLGQEARLAGAVGVQERRLVLIHPERARKVSRKARTFLAAGELDTPVDMPANSGNTPTLPFRLLCGGQVQRSIRYRPARRCRYQPKRSTWVEVAAFRRK